MIEKKITAKIDKMIAFGSLEEEQAKEMLSLENLLSEHSEQQSQEEEKEEKKDEEKVE